jgi:hypothetical protein
MKHISKRNQNTVVRAKISDSRVFILRVKTAGSILRCIQNISLRPTVVEPLLGGAPCCTCSESIRSRNRAFGIQVCIPSSCHPPVLPARNIQDQRPRHKGQLPLPFSNGKLNMSSCGHRTRCTSSAKAARSPYHATTVTWITNTTSSWLRSSTA